MIRRRKGRALPAPSSLILFFVVLVVYAVVSALLQQKSFAKVSSSNEEMRPVWKKSLEVQLASLRAANLQERSARLSSGHANTTTSAGPPPEIPPQRRYFPGRKVVPTTTEDSRPPLSDLLEDDGKITGDVQFLLDFAIVGFGKCGTSTLMDWLAGHASVAIFSREVYDLMHQQPGRLVRSLYEDLPAGEDFLRGYKNPLEVTLPHVLDYYRTYWPTTKLILGLRHPVSWFQSLYNFRVQNALPGEDNMPDPNSLVGRCYGASRNTCTEKGNFAYALLQLGKTNDGGPQPTTALADRIVGHYKRLWFNVSNVPYLPNPVFAYHTEQMQAAPDRLARDLEHFLGLTSPLSPLPHSKPGLTLMHVADQQRKDQLKIDICDPAYRPLRDALVRMGAMGAQWIEQEFLQASSSVQVADPDQFLTLLQSWSVDPCPALPSPGEKGTAARKNLPRSSPEHDTLIQTAHPLRVRFG